MRLVTDHTHLTKAQIHLAICPLYKNTTNDSTISGLGIPWPSAASPRDTSRTTYIFALNRKAVAPDGANTMFGQGI